MGELISMVLVVALFMLILILAQQVVTRQEIKRLREQLLNLRTTVTRRTTHESDWNRVYESMGMRPYPREQHGVVQMIDLILDYLKVKPVTRSTSASRTERYETRQTSLEYK